MTRFDFEGKVALVTGGSSGIGKAAALAFAQAGANVAIASRRKTKATKALKELEQAGAEAIWIETDVSEGKRVKRLVDEVVSRFGRLDIAFNNGGSGGRSARVADMSEEAWIKSMNGYLTSVFLCMKYQIPAMLETGGGVITNNASVDGLRGYPFPGGAAYAAAKHGVVGLTKTAAREYIQQGVRINAIAPGWVATPPINNWMAKDEAMAAEIIGQEPIGRLARPEEIAALVTWLSSDQASFMVGAAIPIDGGYLA